ncbi:hypothetical protein [Clavibacter sp. VKM Ac-2872]|uniref:hypothetical protein n=1 Tax=Clavibacter sp. VKM Ac-2872 TaxID=2783812 RepID=UPI00188D9288|nr:hypothetical protein [Clavibacter sp. VKM Ac-2872]MBF4625811.1 hypothetical protein [Clavibacter sp. VKM Ac-2872]
MSFGHHTATTLRHSVMARLWMGVIALTIFGIACGVALLIALPISISNAINSTPDQNLQMVKEVGCISYADGVLDLAKQGYTAEQIQNVYEAATTPEPDADRLDDAPSGLAIRYCGAPQHIIDSAK